MTIRAVGIKGDENVWKNTSQVTNDPGGGFSGIYLVQVAINVIEKFHIADTKFLRGLEQFSLTDFAERFQIRVIFFVTEPAVFTARGRDQIGLDALVTNFASVPPMPSDSSSG